MYLNQTISGSMLESFYPKGWDLEKIRECCSHSPESIFERQNYWNDHFKITSSRNQVEFAAYMGHEIAMQIRETKEKGQKLILILPVGPLSMYHWTVYFLKEWGIDAKHVHGFNMDEWCDQNGNAIDPSHPTSFQHAMEKNFYNPLEEYTVPESQRHFAQRESMLAYDENIARLRAEGAKLVVVYGIGRVCHIAFWEPHMAEEFPSEEEWKKQTYRLALPLHPLTVEQNSITSFSGNYTINPSCFGNTIGPGIFLDADYAIGGCDGTFENTMQWQGVSLWLTLRYGPSTWVPSTYMPTLPGRLFFVDQLAGPLGPQF
jgi:glucosamine-6-phosphate deaminase